MQTTSKMTTTVVSNRGQQNSASNHKESSSTRPHSSIGSEDVFQRLYTSATCASSKQRLHSCPHCLKTKIFSTFTPSGPSGTGLGKSFIHATPLGSSTRHYTSMSHMNYFNSDPHITHMTSHVKLQPKLSLPTNSLAMKNFNIQTPHEKAAQPAPALLPLRKKSPAQIAPLSAPIMTKVTETRSPFVEEKTSLTSLTLASDLTSHHLMNKKVVDWLSHYHQEELPSISPVT